LIFHMFGALAEFERDLIRERTQAGLTAARARGRLGGPASPGCAMRDAWSFVPTASLMRRASS
jgi:DNA invertase Pin-like site-specific DNA recombinase